MSNQSIQLTIRCALETFSDYNVECSTDWTILHLKEHLAQICDLKPDVTCQRLIYAGRCLENGQKISEVLKLQRDGIQHPAEEQLEKQVIHMVYIGNLKQRSGERIRHRSNVNSNSNGNIQSPPNMDPNFGQLPPMMAPPNYGIQQQSHEAWMTAYNNYMAQMMQFYQYGGMPVMPYRAQYNNPAVNQFGQHNLFTNQPQFMGVPPAFGNPQNGEQMPLIPENAPPAVNNDLLNVRAAVPDFLDLVYKSIRFILLAMVLYLYSSLERFFFVISIVGIFWFLRARRDQQGRQQPQQNQQNARGNGAVEEQQRGAHQPEVNPNQQPQQFQASQANANVPSANPAGNNAWNIFFQTIHSFFTSLIPEPAPPLEIN